MDWDNGGPLKGWYAMVHDGGNRKSFDVAISQDGTNWQKVLSLGQKAQGMSWHPELTGQGIVQTPDRKLHISASGRGGSYIWHVVVDPDVLVKNSQPANSGEISLCGGRLQGEEASDQGVAFTVMRNGGTQGAASVQYTTVYGDAKAGKNYTAVSGSVSWEMATADRAKTGPINVGIPIRRDDAYKGNKTFHFEISSPTNGAMLGTRRKSICTLVERDLGATTGIEAKRPTPAPPKERLLNVVGRTPQALRVRVAPSVIGEAGIQLLGMDGRIHARATHPGRGQEATVELSTGHLPHGIYMLRLEAADRTAVQYAVPLH